MWTFEYTDANSQTQAGSPCGAASFKTPWDAQKELTRKLWEPTTDPDESGNLDGKILCNYHNYISDNILFHLNFEHYRIHNYLERKRRYNVFNS